LAEAVRALLHDSTRRRLMGERGRFAASRHLSWESAAAKMEALYRKISRTHAAAALE